MAYNHVTLVGTLAKDPVTKMVGKKARTDFTIGVERYAGKDKEAEVDFFNIVTWGKLAEVSGEFLKQGKKILVDGRIQVRHSDVPGNRWITEVIAENLRFLSKVTDNA
jgi:single-strand DNA-binding protein